MYGMDCGAWIIVKAAVFLISRAQGVSLHAAWKGCLLEYFSCRGYVLLTGFQSLSPFHSDLQYRIDI